VSARKTLAVVVPCRDEQDNVAPFYAEAKAALEGLPLDWSLVFVDDASADATYERILALRAQDPRVKIAALTRGFGYHAALVAGLSSVDADLYAIVDVDGEDPPELLAKFHAAIEGGARTVYGIRDRRPEPEWLIFLRWLFYAINQRIADGPTRLWMAEFSMFTREVRDFILSSRTTFPFLRSELAYAGLRLEGVPYVRRARRRGRSHYNVLSMAKFAVAGFLASSTFPLRFVAYAAAAFAALFLWLRLGLTLVETGALAAVFGFAYLLLALPLIALYLARTYKNATGRPVFMLDRERSRL